MEYYNCLTTTRITSQATGAMITISAALRPIGQITMPKLLITLCLLALTACSPSEEPVGEQAPQNPATQNGETSNATMPSPTRPDAVVTIAADPWCPHNCTAGSPDEGYAVDIAREAFALSGIKVQYVNMSWARALQQTESGHIDAVVGAFVSDAPNFVFPDQASGYSRTALFTNPESDWQWEGIESLQDQTLMVINGYSYSPEIDAYVDRHKDDPARVLVLSGTSPLNRAIELLEQGRSDVFPEDQAVMNWTIRNSDHSIVPRQAAMIYESPFYIAFSPAKSDSPKLSKLLSQGIIKLRESGKFEQILAPYGLSQP